MTRPPITITLYGDYIVCRFTVRDMCDHAQSGYEEYAIQSKLEGATPAEVDANAREAAALLVRCAQANIDAFSAEHYHEGAQIRPGKAPAVVATEEA